MFVSQRNFKKILLDRIGNKSITDIKEATTIAPCQAVSVSSVTSAIKPNGQKSNLNQSEKMYKFF